MDSIGKILLMQWGRGRGLDLNFILKNARVKRDTGKFQEAVADYEECLLLYPKRIEIWLEYAVLLEKSGRMAPAQTAYEKARRLEPADAKSLCAIADAMRDAGMNRQAAEYYLKARAKGARDPHIAHFLAGDAMRNRAWPQAIAEYEAWLATNPDSPNEWIQLGHALKEQGETQRAQAAYLRALQMGARDPHMASFFQDTNGLEVALRAQITRICPDCPDSFVTPPDPAPPLNFTRLMLDYVRCKAEGRSSLSLSSSSPSI